MPNNYQRAFVIFYAVLLVSIVLIISMSIFNIVVRQIIISLTIRDSQYAFSAADSAIDCTKYWDVVYDSEEGLKKDSSRPFGYQDDSGTFVPSTFPPNLLACGGVTTTLGPRQAANDAGGTEFSLNFDDSAIGGKELCAKVSVTYKSDIDPDLGRSRPGRSIVVDGYNTSCSNVDTGTLSSRVVQRTLVTSY